jgi:hypothetical protein
MEYIFGKGEIVYPNKELTVLDKLVIDFLSRINVDYVIVSGYIAILFGRDRHTEDIDMFIRTISHAAFSRLYKRIIGSGRYYCINADNADDAYEILQEKSSIRFAEKGTFDPNFEIKFPQNELNKYSIDNAIKVKLGGHKEIRISPIELQLAYKLYLGSEKDYEDAAHMYAIFKNDIDKVELKRFLERLHIKARLVKMVLRENL